MENFGIGLEARIAGDPEDELMLDVALHHGGRLLANDSYRVQDREQVDRVIVLSDPGIDDFRNELL